MTGRGRAAGRRDQGMTLIELLLAASLLMVLMAVGFTTLMGVKDGASRTRAQHDLNEEGRNALNRMVREIRQATELRFVVNPDGPAYDPAKLTAVSFRADFNNDGCAGNAAPCVTNAVTNPESLTYCYDPQGVGAEKTYLWLIPVELATIPTSCNIPGSGALPILAGNVAAFSAEYRSNQYRFDTAPDSVQDPKGVTTWRELDGAIPPIGDAGGSDGNINTSALKSVNSVVLKLRMAKQGLEQDYTTQVDVRNKP